MVCFLSFVPLFVHSFFFTGCIIGLHAYGKHTVVLNTYEDCKELLEKRAIIYSDRPYLPILDLCVVTDFTVDPAFIMPLAYINLQNRLAQYQRWPYWLWLGVEKP